ncbi:MAG: YtxH domain-containing protein [Chloroflexi bacterium]|nr:YtxH domain-containing protein [Chloroflexota bacterium]
MARGPGFLAGVVIGGIVGAGAALLFAPKAGEQMRRQLLEGRGEWGTRLEDAASLARATAESLVDVSRDVIEQQRHRFKEAVEESREAAEQTTTEMFSEFKKAQRGEEHRR